MIVAFGFGGTCTAGDLRLRRRTLDQGPSATVWITGLWSHAGRSVLVMAAPRKSSKKPSESQGEPELLVPRVPFAETLCDRIALGEELNDREIRAEDELEAARQAYYSWDEFNETLLRRSFSTSKVADGYSATPGFFVMGGGPDPFPVRIKEFHDDVAVKLRRLTSLKEQLQLYGDGPSESASPASAPSAWGTGVFVVHGHHEALKQQVARTIERLTGTPPIILHEQPDGGRTIIEKSPGMSDLRSCCSLPTIGARRRRATSCSQELVRTWCSNSATSSGGSAALA